MSGLQRICIHWTAGTFKASDFDRQFYHFLVEDDGKIINGKLPPEANIPPLVSGHYAAHCGGGNSHTIGISLCGMADFRYIVGHGYAAEKYPLNEKQCEAAWKLAADLCRKYGITEISEQTIFTHYEFGRSHPDTPSRGKVDIVYLPFKPELHPGEIGDYIRKKVAWYMNGGTDK